jgi:haloacid dehalogenase-like hydrolase
MKMKPYFDLVYDFDGTIAPGNMQERDFIPAIGMKTLKFWKEVTDISKEHQADNILVYMKLMVDKAQSARAKLEKKILNHMARGFLLFEGILLYKDQDGKMQKDWFDRIDEYGKQSRVKVEHYIVSLGIKEMIYGTTIAKKFKAIYASSFFYKHHGVAVWPSLAINYTTKTQYLFRINKGCLDVSENKKINEYAPENDRHIPFRNIVYLGDGDTDIPCFRLSKDRGGHAIAAYKPNTKGAKGKLKELIQIGRADSIVSVDYRNNTLLFEL